MPSVSKKQHNLMAAVAHNPKFAKKVGIPQSVGKEFNKADKGKQFKRGGEMGIKNTNGSFDGLKASDVENMHKRNAEKKRAAVAAKKSAAKAEVKDTGSAYSFLKPTSQQLKNRAMAARKAAAPAAKPAAKKLVPYADLVKKNDAKAAMQAKKAAAPAAKPAAPTPAPEQETMAPRVKALPPAMKKGGKVCGMKAGGVKKELPTAKDLGSMNMKKGGRVKCMAGGGYVRAADGVTKKGKTKGKII
jgi:hypothetical protein